MAIISNVILKLAKRERLTPGELGALKLWANSAENDLAFVEGIRSGRSSVFANSLVANNTAFSRIQKFDVISDIASFELSVPPNCEHLFIIGSARTDRASYNDILAVQFNSDTGNNYSEQYEGGQNAAQIQGGVAAQAYISLCVTTANSSTANTHGAFFAYIPNIRSLLWKSVIGVSGSPSYSATDMISRTTGGFWQNTAPLKTVKFFSANSANIKTGSSISIYGIL